MRSIFEQVDEFIEGFFDGRIVSIISDGSEKLITMGFQAKDADYMHSSLRDLIGYINEYVKVEKTESEKMDLAINIFQIIIELRNRGIIRNNPASITELNHYKTLNEKLGKENSELQNTVKNLTEKIMMLTPIKDEKVGII